MPQLVKHLPFKHLDLSSIPMSTQMHSTLEHTHFNPSDGKAETGMPETH